MQKIVNERMILMTNKDRQNSIKEIIHDKLKVKVSDLSIHFSVTPETIRRDLETLERDGYVTRTHGGAILKPSIETPNSDQSVYMSRRLLNHAEKTKMAEVLIRSKLIPDYASILCDSSSTVFRALQMLYDRDDLTVIVNNLRIVEELSRTKLNVVFTGGNVNPRTHSLEGPFATDTVLKSHVDIVLVSSLGLTLDGGVFDSYGAEAEIKKLMLNQGKKVILMADHTKLNKKSIIQLWDIEAIDIFITDVQPSPVWMELFQEKNVTVYFPTSDNLL